MNNINSFIEQYADSIICEPSGLTYNQLKETKIQKIMIVKKNIQLIKERENGYILHLWIKCLNFLSSNNNNNNNNNNNKMKTSK